MRNIFIIYNSSVANLNKFIEIYFRMERVLPFPMQLGNAKYVHECNGHHKVDLHCSASRIHKVNFPPQLLVSDLINDGLNLSLCEFLQGGR
jgi:hypothetical protein